MSNVAPFLKKIHSQEVAFRSAISEGLFNTTGGTINFVLDNVNITPVATIEAAFLTEVQFQVQKGVGWILADGRSVSGSAYYSLTGRTNVPDCRGLFLRGRDHGRGIVPEGNVDVTTYLGDTFESHTHGNTVDFGGMGFGNRDHTNVEAGDARPQCLPDWPAYTNIFNTGGNETRSQNITVNYFIRIN